MKKRMGKVLSGLIILTMIISSTGFAFAGEKVLDDSASQKSIKLTTKQNSDVEKNLEKKLESDYHRNYIRCACKPCVHSCYGCSF